MESSEFICVEWWRWIACGARPNYHGAVLDFEQGKGIQKSWANTTRHTRTTFVRQTNPPSSIE